MSKLLPYNQFVVSRPSEIYYVLKSDGPDAEAVGKAFGVAGHLASQSTKQLVIAAIETKTTLDIFRDVVNDAFVDALVKKKQVGVSFNNVDCTVFLRTRRIAERGFTSGPILALHLPPKDMAGVLADPRATSVVYIPWVQEELKELLRLQPNAKPVD